MLPPLLLQYDAESPTVGLGAIRTIRWHDGEPVGDDYARGEFAGMKRILGTMLDTGVFDRETALHVLEQHLVATVGPNRTLHVGAIEYGCAPD